MNKKFDVISMVLIIALTIILIAFVFNYFTNSNETTPANTNNTLESTNIDVQNVSGSNPFVTSTPVTSKPEEIAQDVHIIDTIISGDVEVKEETAVVAPKDNNPVIITSNDNISDKEKKEVLKELDETLMDLLDVIETVQIVDESRLPADGSEVQP